MRQALRNSFLVKTAAAALVTGITIASAQGPGGNMGGGGGAATSSGGGGAERHQGPSGGGNAQSSGTERRSGGQLGETREQRGHAYGEERNERGKALGEQRGMRDQNEPGTRSSTGTQTGETREQRGRAFGEERNERGQVRGEQRGTRELRGERGHAFGEERHERSRGSTGFAREHGGRSVELSSDQRSRIHDVFTRDRNRFDRFRVGRVDFDVRAGVRIPKRLHLFALPSDIVEVVPEYRDYRFFYYEDEIVIVDPVTLEIVAVIPA
jgi:hypothetical protein